MPVRSLHSSVLRWPDADAVDGAVRAWAQEAGRDRANVIRIGYFGSYARGDWSVGSDLDLVVVVERADEPFNRRSIRWDTSRLPVPADVIVYTREEWESLLARTRFGRVLTAEAVWVYEREKQGEEGRS